MTYILTEAVNDAHLRAIFNSCRINDNAIANKSSNRQPTAARRFIKRKSTGAKIPSVTDYFKSKHKCNIECAWNNAQSVYDLARFYKQEHKLWKCTKLYLRAANM